LANLRDKTKIRPNSSSSSSVMSQQRPMLITGEMRWAGELPELGSGSWQRLLRKEGKEGRKAEAMAMFLTRILQNYSILC
jgi:hypothetical protein